MFYVANRNAAFYRFDLSTKEGVIRFIGFLAGLQRHASELKARFESVRDGLLTRIISKRGILRMEAGASMPQWVLCLHRRNILAVGNASDLQTQGSGGR